MSPIDVRELAADLTSYLQDGLKISAMKAIRSMTGCGLMEAKEIVEAYYKAFPQPKPQISDILQPTPQYIVACQTDYETWTNIFNSEQAAMDYAEYRPNENCTVGKVIAKSVAKTTYTLEKV